MSIPLWYTEEAPAAPLSPLPLTPILDNFNRPNEGPPMTGWLDITEGLKVVDNQACGSVPFSNYSLWNDPNIGPNCEIYEEIPTLPDNNGSITIILRADPTGMLTGYTAQFYRNDTMGDAITIMDINSNILLVVAQEMTAGDSIRLRAVGSTLTTYHKTAVGNWNEIGSVTDATYNNAGYIGTLTSENASRLDNFGGGTI